MTGIGSAAADARRMTGVLAVADAQAGQTREQISPHVPWRGRRAGVKMVLGALATPTFLWS